MQPHADIKTPLATFIVVLLFGTFLFFGVVSERFVPRMPRPAPVVEPSKTPVSNPSEGMVILTHSFIPKSAESGTHVYRGTMRMPTPCHRLKSDVAVLESFPEQFAFSFTIIEYDGACVQVIAEKQFEVRADGNVRATVSSVKVNGKAVQFSVQEEAVAVPPDTGQGIRLDVPFRLGFREEKRMGDIALRFLGLVADSRCPENADCVWAGEAVLAFEVRDPREVPPSPEIVPLSFPVTSSRTVPGARRAARFHDYTVNFAGLEPVAPRGERMPISAYVATLVITQK